MDTGHTDATTAGHMQIGEAAERVGLSIRTIRHYEETGLVIPSARSEGGFRLYTEPDLDRLRVIKRMKPLGFTLEEMRHLLQTLDGVAVADGDDRIHLVDQLAVFHAAAQTRVQALREQIDMAEVIAHQIQEQMDQHNH
ncbi:MerR family transcriptional regulator [Actinoplanes solisilvae]|uniref:MerR family transcriptional regulator n=1 Tax=Actinoplanes solisilvae TaxID=2486853 RepID=UPI001F0B93E2|nr:MerR family transcriptional regulator [Actinoplanes solisilvae]